MNSAFLYSYFVVITKLYPGSMNQGALSEHLKEALADLVLDSSILKKYTEEHSGTLPFIHVVGV